MSSLFELRKRFESLNINELAREAVEETKQEIISLQRDQMLHGLKKDGSKIGKYKDDKYAAKKFSKNPLAGFGNVDLKLENDFQNDIFVDVRVNTLVIDSADEKTPKLIDDYGDPFGLEKERLDKYNSISQKVLNKKIINKVTRK